MSTSSCDFESDEFTEFSDFQNQIDPFYFPLIPERQLTWMEQYPYIDNGYFRLQLGVFQQEWINYPTRTEQSSER